MTLVRTCATFWRIVYVKFYFELTRTATASTTGGDSDASVPRAAVGIVNEHGNIVDKDGNVVGEVGQISHNASKLVGSTVTATGDVVAESGDILGKASLGNEYTTQTDKGTKSGGGWNITGKAKSVYDTVNKARGPINTAVKGYNTWSQFQDGNKEGNQSGQLPQNTSSENVPGANINSPINVEDHDDSNEAEKRSSADTGPGNAVNEHTCKKFKGQDGSPIDSPNPADARESARNVQNTTENDTKEASDSTKDVQHGDCSLEVQSPRPIEETAETASVEGTGRNQAEVGDDNVAMLDSDNAKAIGEEDVANTQNNEEMLDVDEAKDADEGNIMKPEGEAQKLDAEEPQNNEDMPDVEATQPIDFSVLKGTTVNKAGNLVNKDGDIIGRLAEGSDAKKLVGKTVDEEGNIWNDTGRVIGKAEPIPESEREDATKDFAPFENFPDAIVEADGRVTSDGKQVGEVVEGDPKRLKGARVDEDGDILDRRGNAIGRAQAWEEPEPEPEVPVEDPDRSCLAGKRVNKAGNVVDSDGTIYGRVVEGNTKALVGRMCDKDGNIMSESGERVGKAEIVPEHEREGSKEGPFAELEGLSISKDDKVITHSGDVVGRLISGDSKKLYGRPVDEDGDVIDKNGNVIGKAERWEEPVVEKKKSPLAGRKVNREGNIVDEDGNVIAKLVSGDISICAGKEVDDDGDVINSKGNTVGHASLLEDIPPEPTESAEDKESREQAEKDKQLAATLATSVEGSLEKLRPILKMITDKVDTADKTPKEELDEEQLVKEVKPLIEEGGKILTETNGVIRGMDPDGRIQRNAKHKSKTNDASPEEHHLAEVLQEVSSHNASIGAPHTDT